MMNTQSTWGKQRVRRKRSARPKAQSKIRSLSADIRSNQQPSATKAQRKNQLKH